MATPRYDPVMAAGDEDQEIEKEIRRLREAVERDPDDVELRLALVARLLEADQPQGAWHNCLYVLGRDPNHVQALGLAKKAAETAGASERAEEYVARLAALLSTPARSSRGDGPLLRLIRGGREDTGKIRLVRMRSTTRVR
jgi:Tfp pilus assembly protein PilF